jgi:DNA primase
MNSQTAKQIPITEFMQKIGYQAQQNNGVFVWYQSPFVDSQQHTGSFRIDTSQNIWYDYSQHKGGKIIDLVMSLQNCTVNAALQYLRALFGDFAPNFSFAQQKQPTQQAAPQSKITIKKVKPLTNKALLQYLAERRISTEIATKYLIEVYYSTYKNENKNYFSVGFANDKGGYELRNRLFKGGSSPKAISTIVGKTPNKGVCIFEGFIDFLSCLEYHKTLTPKYDCIVLNSVGFAATVIQQAKHYEKVFCFLDNDTAGRATLTALQQSHPQVRDFSQLYSAYKDFNDFWQHYQ